MSMVIATLSKGVRNNTIDSNASLVYILLSVNETSKVTENRCSWVQQSQSSLVTLGCSEQRSADPKERQRVETSPGIQKQQAENPPESRYQEQHRPQVSHREQTWNNDLTKTRPNAETNIEQLMSSSWNSWTNHRKYTKRPEGSCIYEPWQKVLPWSSGNQTWSFLLKSAFFISVGLWSDTCAIKIIESLRDN